MKRIAMEQLDAAIEELAVRGPGTDTAIHEMRKRMKRLRGQLRLIRPAVGETVYRRENECFRDASRALSGAREAAVALATFDALVARSTASIAPAAFRELRSQLAHQYAHALEHAVSERHEDASQLLTKARQRVVDWPLSHRGWKTVGPGFERTYDRARRAFNRARREPTTEHFHDLRKWTKYHLHQVQILEDTWPDALQQRRSVLKELSELLGDEHDLADLRARLLALPLGMGENPALGALLALLDRRREHLRQRARSLGSRLFAEKPGAIGRRFRAFFRAFLTEVPSEVAPPSHGDADEAQAERPTGRASEHYALS